MAANSRSEGDRSLNGLPPSDAWLFAKAILSEPVSDAPSAVAPANSEREQLEWLAQFSTRHEEQLRKLRESEAEARRQRDQLEWLASISTEHERNLQRVLEEDAATCKAQEQWDAAIESWNAQEAWDPTKHPRLGRPPNPGWWASTRGSARVVSVGDESRRDNCSSFLDNVIRRNSTIAGLSGVNTPSMIASSRLAADLEAAGWLPDAVTRAAAAGLGTGGKAIVNGSATAIKNVATLGLDTSQLELIGVTKADRDRGYDNALAIATASGEVLIAVGTSGLASALSKGGTVARTASGTLVAFDATGNAVGVVQGAYDASKNGLDLRNGVQIAGGLLGLSANAIAVKALTSSSPRRIGPRKLPQTLHDVDLVARVSAANGSTLESAGELFGWKPRYVTKGPKDFMREMLLSQGWTNERLLDVAEGYEHVARITPANPSAAGRAKQLREIVETIFKE